MDSTSVREKQTNGAPVSLPLVSSSAFSLEQCRQSAVTEADITAIFCIRLHQENSWILERLDKLRSYYDPCPPVLIVDFGSDDEYAECIRAMCSERGYMHHYVADEGVFSLSSARNEGAQRATTDFLFFCDPDFIGDRRLFEELSHAATALSMRNVIDIVMLPPAIHLGEAETLAFASLKTADEQSMFLRSLAFTRTFTAVDKSQERYTAPYSNVFLINRLMFSMAGGYDSNFRGHGSEDFEFLLRLCIHTGHLPLPTDPQEDFAGPLKDEYYTARGYKGFRRLFELMALPAESLGFRVFHLHHPRNGNSEWHSTGDRKRAKFKNASGRYVAAAHNLLSVDHLQRNKTIACLCKQADMWGYFIPLRLAGYRILPFFTDDVKTLASITAAITSGEIDDVAIFNPYMKSNSSWLPIVMLARQLKRNVIVIERGALPGTIYYDDDVAYNSESFTYDDFKKSTYTAAQLAEAERYVIRLKLGEATLEQMVAYSVTSDKYSALRELKAIKCFIPLQLEDDMAVTMFIGDHQPYPEFLADLPKLVTSNPDIIFIVKPHPLSKRDGLQPMPNMIISDREDNVHCLLDIACLTLCYNSGVGLLSILQGTPTITVGNAFYNLPGAGHQTVSPAAGIADFRLGKVTPACSSVITRLAAWLIHDKYSIFSATDTIRDQATRKAHNYRDILVTQFRWREHRHALGRVRNLAPFSWKSHAAARISPLEGGKPKFEPDGEALIKQASKDYHSGRYEKASQNFRAAYKKSPSRANILRFAAEAEIKRGRRDRAIELLTQAVIALPNNQRTRKRLLVTKYPLLRYVLGAHEMEIPKY